VTKQVSTPSRPPAPLPSRTSQPPPAIGRGKPLGTNTGKTGASKPPPAAKAGDKDKKDASAGSGTLGKKSARRSRDNLQAESRAALKLMAGSASAGDAPTAESAKGAVELPVAEGRVRKSSADEWDASPTQDLTGDELAWAHAVPPAAATETDVERTVVGAPPDAVRQTIDKLQRAPDPKPGAAGSGPPSRSSPPATVAGTSLAGGNDAAKTGAHDPRIQTSQAVRVVVWRDGTGIHVAPAGTVVSAITVDAVLVALEPSTDLTAWLSQRSR
jgi:hypothetical protein